MKYSKIILTLAYLYWNRDIKYATGSTIHAAMDGAHTWIQKHFPKSFEDTKNAILERHGFTPETWAEVMQLSGSFYFLPTPEQDACNKEIKKYLYSLIHICSINSYSNYTSAMLKNIVRQKNPQVFRYKKHGLYYYYIKKDLAIEILDELRTQIN